MTKGALDLWAWPIYPLDGGGELHRGPSGWELTLGPIGDHGRPRRRPSLPPGPEGEAMLRVCLRATASLGPFVVLPWAARSGDDAACLVAALERSWGRPHADVVVPLAPAGFMVDAARRVREEGFRRAAVGEPYLHRAAVERLELGAADLVLLAPVPPRAQPHWLRQMASLGLERTATVARGVASRNLAAALSHAGVSHADGTVFGPPKRVSLAVAVGG